MIPNIIFKELKPAEINSFAALVNNVFDEFVGNDYSDEGKNSFKDYLKPEAISTRLTEKTSRFFIAKIESELVGVLEIKNKSHVSLFFVKKEFQKQGIGKKLFADYKKLLQQNNPEIKIMDVNSSFYAEPIYAKLGFARTDSPQEKNGIKYIPMKLEF